MSKNGRRVYFAFVFIGRRKDGVDGCVGTYIYIWVDMDARMWRNVGEGEGVKLFRVMVVLWDIGWER